MSGNHPLFIIQIPAGVDDYPTVPPGVIVLLAAALAVVLLPWRWTPIIGVALCLAIFVEAFFGYDSTIGRLSVRVRSGRSSAP
jgi:hypothetical protein